MELVGFGILEGYSDSDASIETHNTYTVKFITKVLNSLPSAAKAKNDKMNEESTEESVVTNKDEDKMTSKTIFDDNLSDQEGKSAVSMHELDVEVKNSNTDSEETLAGNNDGITKNCGLNHKDAFAVASNEVDDTINPSNTVSEETLGGEPDGTSADSSQNR